MRGVDRRPANDDGSLQAEGYALVDLVAQRRFGRITASLSVDNLLDADWREAQFAETSRVMPGAPLVEDVHFTPGAPRTLFLGLGMAL
jgi:outer membrane receptor protein involved in Fe transport